MSTDRHEVLKAWIAAILWLIVIAIESSAMLSAHNTGRILYPLLHFLFGLDREHFEVWHFYIRKSGHVVGYGTLEHPAFPRLARHSARAEPPEVDHALGQHRDPGDRPGSQPRRMAPDLHPVAHGRWHDVVLDTCAGIAAQVLVLLWIRSFGKRTVSTS